MYLGSRLSRRTRPHRGVTRLGSTVHCSLFPVVNSVSYSIFAANAQNTQTIALNETELQDLLPGIINELGQENLDQLKQLAGDFPGGDGGAGDDDDDVPDLVENFEEASK